MKYEVELAGGRSVVQVRSAREGWEVSVDGGPWRGVGGHRIGGTAWRLDAGEGARTVDVALEGERAFLRTASGQWGGTVVDSRARGLEVGAGASAGTVRTSMPGAVARVLVVVGQAVTHGQVLVVVEAMKMENEFRAPHDGVVESVPVAVGMAVEAGALLVVVTNP